jgi:cytochrome c5
MRTRWLVLIFAVAGYVHGSTLYAQSSAGSYSSGESQITRKVPRPSATDSTYDVGPYKLYRSALEEGEGSREVSANCNTCHSLRYITMQPPLAADAWAAEVTKMVKTYGASISDDASQKILQYLQSHYTPDKRKH